MQDSKHRYKQTDNIDAFLKFLAAVGMPSVGIGARICLSVLKFQTFTFDPIDLYEKKNIPKVIFCVHVLRYVSYKLLL
jgi:Ras GTPase-activating-like protein IQGAP2/3